MTDPEAPKLAAADVTVPVFQDRKQVEDALAKEISSAAEDGLSHVEDEEVKAKIRAGLKRTGAIVQLLNLFMNEMSKDGAALTVNHFENQYHMAEYLSYQAAVNRRLFDEITSLRKSVAAMAAAIADSSEKMAAVLESTADVVDPKGRRKK